MMALLRLYRRWLDRRAQRKVKKAKPLSTSHAWVDTLKREAEIADSLASDIDSMKQDWKYRSHTDHISSLGTQMSSARSRRSSERRDDTHMSHHAGHSGFTMGMMGGSSGGSSGGGSSCGGSSSSSSSGGGDSGGGGC